MAADSNRSVVAPQKLEGRIINVRRLVSLDIVLHGERFIMLEFGIGTPGILLIGYYLTVTGPFLLGLYLFLTGLNYIPILAYTIVTIRHHSAKRDVEQEMTSEPHYVRKYSIQQFLIFIPFVITLLAVAQKFRSE